MRWISPIFGRRIGLRPSRARVLGYSELAFVIIFSFLLSIPSAYAGSENIVMNVPSGSQRLNQASSQGDELYTYKVNSDVIEGENGLLVQQILSTVPPSISSEMVRKSLPEKYLSCKGEWSAYRLEKISPESSIFSRECEIKDQSVVLVYQSSRLLVGDERAFLVTFLWEMPDDEPVARNSDVLSALVSETRRHLGTIRICNGTSNEPCQNTVDEHILKGIEKYLKNNQR